MCSIHDITQSYVTFMLLIVMGMQCENFINMLLMTQRFLKDCHPCPKALPQGVKIDFVI